MAQQLNTIQRQAFTEAYRFYERWHDHPGTEEDWKQCAIAMRDAHDAVGKTPLAFELLNTLYSVISDEIKAREAAKIPAPEQIGMVFDGRTVVGHD